MCSWAAAEAYGYREKPTPNCGTRKSSITEKGGWRSVAEKLDKTISIALPKGRLGEKTYAMLEELGYGCPGVMVYSRKLIFEDEAATVRYFWVKPSDVAIYVEHGAADVGVVGKDILLEYQPDVYELTDLGFGKCRVCVAGPENVTPNPDRTLRIATKF
ncbi:MAG: ATP phosphoribosyltransferase, partial [Clostridia bacterium]|nr:ATP phosphoribosyltransferase [Clostridia bacterium]